MYYVLEEDWSFPETDELDIPEAWELDPLISGQRIDRELPPPPLHFFASILTDLPDALVNRWGYLVFNPRLRRVITQASNDDIQYLKAVIHDKRSTRQRIDYKVANLLVRIEAVDRERSSIDYHDDGDILGVDSLVLDQARIGDHSFFRLRELSPIVIVRDDIAEKIEKSGCTGIKFIAPEQLQF